MHGEKHNIFLERDGISAFVFPIMIPVSCRVEKASIDALYQTLLLMTATYPDAKPETDVFPKMCIVLNNFSRKDGIQGIQHDSDSSDDPDQPKVTLDD